MKKRLLPVFLVSLIPAAALASSAASDDNFEPGHLTKFAKEIGSTACSNQIYRIDWYLNRKSSTDSVWSTAPTEDTDKRYYAFLNAKRYNDNTRGFTFGTFVPMAHRPDSCDITLLHIDTYPNESCASIREKHFAEFSSAGDLSGRPLYERDNIRVALEDVTGSCVVIRSEILSDIK